MQVVEQLGQVAALVGDRPVAATFGVFDGVHLGHQDLVGRAVAWARERGGLTVVLTFVEHPLRLLAPVYAPPVLTPLRRKLALLEQLGVDVAVAVHFTRPFASQPPEQFVRHTLVDQLRARAVFLGFNNRFGRGGTGDTALLARLGEEWGFEVVVVPPVLIGDAVVSATRVRELLLDGQVRRAWALLGRPHDFEGRVVTGEGRGRLLGFPTANLALDEQVLRPCGGVYAVRVRRGPGDGSVHAGMLNIGNRPTFGGLHVSIEAHLLNFEGNLLGQTLTVELIERLRDEQKFESAEALRRQIERDRERATAILSDRPR